MVNKIIRCLSILLFFSFTCFITNVYGTTELEDYVIVNDNIENKYTTFELAVESIDTIS